MRVDLEDDSKRVLHVDHFEGLLVGKILSDRHPLLSPMSHDLLHEALDIGILNAEMEGARLPIVEFLGRFIVGELEQLDPDLVASGKMGDFERVPAFAENIDAHLADGGIRLLLNQGRFHYSIPAHDVFIERDSFFEIRNGKADVGECSWIGAHSWCENTLTIIGFD